MDLSWIKTVAPMIGTALGGPLGGMAVGMLAEKLGVQEKTINAVTNAISETKLTPEQVSSIRQAEIEFQKFLGQNKIDLERINMENTKSAREMHVAKQSYTPQVMSLVITVGFFGVLYYMLTMEAKPTEALLIMLGSLGTAWAAVVNFWFGSTAGSARKTELIAQSPAIGTDK
jgi:plasmid maintenance system antidote protein VapI